MEEQNGVAGTVPPGCGGRLIWLFLDLGLATNDLLDQFQGVDSECQHVLLTVGTLTGVKLDLLST